MQHNDAEEFDKRRRLAFLMGFASFAFAAAALVAALAIVWRVFGVK